MLMLVRTAQAAAALLYLAHCSTYAHGLMTSEEAHPRCFLHAVSLAA
jgi:hypothetical protein